MLLSGCSLLFTFDDGKAEAARLRAVIEDLPGVDSVDVDGSQQSPTFAATARTQVHLVPTATADEFEAVLLAWHSAATDPDADDGIRRKLDVDYRAGRCEAEMDADTPSEQVEGTARFLPAVCDGYPAVSISTDDTWYSRNVTIRGADDSAGTPVDIDQLRHLPGAITPLDIWKVDGTEHRFGS